MKNVDKRTGQSINKKETGVNRPETVQKNEKPEDEQTSGAREKASDGKVRIENEILPVPEVPRLCEEIEGLKRERIGVDENCELYVEEEGEGEPVILLHGGPGATHHYFHPHFSALKDSARIISYDQRGCGLSDRVEVEGYSIDQAVEDLENLRKKLGIERWTLAGHSYGGLLAQHYAKKYPRNVKGMVLVCATPGLVGLEPSRSGEYLSRAESKRIDDIHQDPALSKQEKLYNAFLNGDWKQQELYKPSEEEMAQLSLYEWDHDPEFRNKVGQEADQSDLEGVFDDCPIPTLIIEGQQDLTWGEDKATRLEKNHPGARMVEFHDSAHSPFKDEPEKFISEMQSFLEGLPAEPSADLSLWEEHVAGWEKARESSPDTFIGELSMKEGRSAYEKIAAAYSPDWLETMKYPSSIREAGFALYDTGNYEEALKCFQKICENPTADEIDTAIADIWQGHMLDLLGRRDEAVKKYQKAAEMNIDVDVSHETLDSKYNVSVYAAKRVIEPFTRPE